MSSCRPLCSLPSVSHPRRRPGPASSWLHGSSVALSKHCLCVTAFSRDHTGIPQISPKHCWYPLSISRQGSALSCNAQAKSKFGHSTMANAFKSCYPIMWRPWVGDKCASTWELCCQSSLFSSKEWRVKGRQYSRWNKINNLKTITFVMSFYCLQPSQCKYLLFHLQSKAGLLIAYLLSELIYLSQQQPLLHPKLKELLIRTLKMNSDHIRRCSEKHSRWDPTQSVARLFDRYCQCGSQSHVLA